MPKFRKRPVEIEAVRWTGENKDEVLDFIGPQGFYQHEYNLIFIYTLEGLMQAKPGDWIIRGVAGEFYPCKPAIFEATYDATDAG